MATKLVVDTSSIYRYSRYYYFDKNKSKEIYDKLNNFIIPKIRSKEIIILDKVYDELGDDEFEKIKNKIKSYKIGSNHLIKDVQTLRKKNYIKSNEKFHNNNPAVINQIIRKYEDRDADLYLIAYCKELISNGHDAHLITEENVKELYYNKLVKKIPTICINEKIKCHTLPYILFEFYSDLKFELDVE
jgi:hypothetical protein